LTHSSGSGRVPPPYEEPVTSRHHPDARRFDTPSRALGSAAVLLFAAALGGCGANVGGFEPEYPPTVSFYSWDSLSVISCRGWLYNFGHVASNARVQLWYATAQGETSRVVLVGNVGDFSRAPFFATPQLTGGEPRFPRVGVISWNGGSQPEETRVPKLQFSAFSPATGDCGSCPPRWCWKSPDSLLGTIYNSGGWAYHVAATLENRDGVRDFAPPLDRVPARNRDDWDITSVARESLGILLPPRILKIRWEDYGGIRDSLVSPPVDTTTTRCY